MRKETIQIRQEIKQTKKKKKEEEEKEINKTKKQFSGKKKKFDKILAMLTRKRERTQIK